MVSRANSYVNLAPSTSRVGSEALSEKKDASFLAKSLGSFYQRKNILSIYIFKFACFQHVFMEKGKTPYLFLPGKAKIPILFANQGLEIFLRSMEKKPKLFEHLVELKRAEMEAPKIQICVEAPNDVFMPLKELRRSVPCIKNEMPHQLLRKSCHRQMVSL